MSFAIYSTTDTTQIQAATSTASSSSSAQQTKTNTQAAQSQDDTVKLSETAQAKLLHQQGQSVSAIASTLGTTAKAINEDLGITLEETIAKTLEETASAA
jgi:uncharacterized FlaG/YvyC family protein